MYFQFATCDRVRALGFLEKFYPGCVVEDTPENAGPLLDLVERDIVRIPDPDFHSGAMFPATNWDATKADEYMQIIRKAHQAMIDTPRIERLEEGK